jgi:hypothetical protein
VAAECPAVSVPADGGPTVPVTMVKASVPPAPGAAPLADVLVEPLVRGSEHPTGAFSTPATETVGWLGSLLHSRKAPADGPAKPVPLSCTTVPLLRPVLGVTVT